MLAKVGNRVCGDQKEQKAHRKQMFFPEIIWFTSLPVLLQIHIKAITVALSDWSVAVTSFFSPILPHLLWQCREVMITIDGEEGIPVQVDGEAWVQRPGLIKIRYKNAAQMLTRDRVRKKVSSFSCIVSSTAITWVLNTSIKQNSSKGGLHANYIRVTLGAY